MIPSIFNLFRRNVEDITVKKDEVNLDIKNYLTNDKNKKKTADLVPKNSSNDVKTNKAINDGEIPVFSCNFSVKSQEPFIYSNLNNDKVSEKKRSNKKGSFSASVSTLSITDNSIFIANAKRRLNSTKNHNIDDIKVNVQENSPVLKNKPVNDDNKRNEPPKKRSKPAEINPEEEYVENTNDDDAISVVTACESDLQENDFEFYDNLDELSFNGIKLHLIKEDLSSIDYYMVRNPHSIINKLVIFHIIDSRSPGILPKISNTLVGMVKSINMNEELKLYFIKIELDTQTLNTCKELLSLNDYSATLIDTNEKCLSIAFDELIYPLINL